MQKCLIISGGDYSPIGDAAKEAFVIACDRGYAYANQEKIVPDLIIGDFDSYEGEAPTGEQVLVLPCVKDDTDTMFAVKWALEHGYQEIEIRCALGGRLDHTYANLQTGAYAAERGARLSIQDASACIFFLRGDSITLPRRENYSLSLFAITDECSGVSIRGAKYELEEGVLQNAFPLGVSNEWAGDQVEISVRTGTLMIMMARE